MTKNNGYVANVSLLIRGLRMISSFGRARKHFSVSLIDYSAMSYAGKRRFSFSHVIQSKKDELPKPETTIEEEVAMLKKNVDELEKSIMAYKKQRRRMFRKYGIDYETLDRLDEIAMK